MPSNSDTDTVDFFIIGFPNPVFTDHPANLSVHPDSEIKEDKINPPKKGEIKTD